MFCLAFSSFWCCSPSILRESIPRQVDKKFGVPKEERGIWGSQVGGKDKCLFFSLHSLVFSSIPISCSIVSNSLWPYGLQQARPPCPSPTPKGLHKLMSIESVMPSNHLILCRSLLLLPSIFPNIRVFSNESALRIRWSKYWSFSFNITPSNEHSGLISFRMDWLDLLAVQGTLKSLL